MIKGERKTVSVNLTQGFPSSNKTEDREWVLTIQDTQSRRTLMEVSLPLLEYALLLSNLGSRPGSAILYDNFGTAGLKREHKRERFTVPGLSTCRWGSEQDKWDNLLREHIPAVIDGWEVQYPYRGSLSQGQLDGDTILVTMERFVEPDGEE